MLAWRCMRSSTGKGLLTQMWRFLAVSVHRTRWILRVRGGRRPAVPDRLPRSVFRRRRWQKPTVHRANHSQRQRRNVNGKRNRKVTQLIVTAIYRLYGQLFIISHSIFWHSFTVITTLLASYGAVYCNRSCLCVCVWVCGWICVFVGLLPR